MGLIGRCWRGLCGALLLAALAGFPVISLADDCEGLPLPSLRLERLEVPASLSSKYTYRTLNNLGASVLRPGHQVLGLTRARIEVRYDLRVVRRLDPGGRFECASPQILISYGYGEMMMYVASEFPEGSCGYRAVAEHERRHVQRYVEHVAQIEAEVTESLRQRFQGIRAWRRPAGETQAELARELNDRWLPYVRRLMLQVEASQAEIDTPEEYARVTTSCDGEIQRVIRASRPGR